MVGVGTCIHHCYAGWRKGSNAARCGATRAVVIHVAKKLLQVERNAQQAGPITALIVDAGRTEFHGVPTRTVLAVGPATHEELQPVTGSLKLL